MRAPQWLAGWAFLALVLAPLESARAQRYAIADSSLAPSLLVAALSLPSTHQLETTDSVYSRRIIRVETQYSRTSTGGSRSMLVLGVRSDDVSLDTIAGWNSTDYGVRAGFARRSTTDDQITISAVELYLGARDFGFLERPGRPNLGAEIVAGWSGIEANTRGSLAFRFPVEFIRARGRIATAFSVVPAIAWGQIRFRSCEDRGPGDNCGDLGTQLAAGRTRFVLGTSFTLAVRPGFSLTAGAQQLFARPQQPRFALALAWGG